MWTVHVIQGYDCVYDVLSAKDRAIIEGNLLRPMADFLSVGSPKIFNRIHNHGVWTVAAVGMTGYVLKDQELVDRAFNGVSIDKRLETFKTEDYNDKALKGFDENAKAGFFVQLDQLFSPDGYYTEGPYYQRFAILPFVLFAQTIQNNQPDIKIFEYRDNIIQKAVHTALQLSYTDGIFFPFNDALKGMAVTSPELVTALDIAYHAYPSNPELLDIAKRQDRVLLSEAGFKVARDVSEGKAKPFQWVSVNLSDGAKGKQGGVGILRHGPSSDQLCQIMRYTSHGLAHGHYDKLSQLLYDNGHEIFQDYGAARFVNVIQKRGGRYLPENTTWAKQTIAHNTVAIDEQSHFGGDIEVSSLHHPELYFYDASKQNYQIMSAKEHHAYPNVSMHRTMILVTDSTLTKPFVLDIFNVAADSMHQMDLPFHYKGQFINLSQDYEVLTDALKPLGKANGYQHLWLVGRGKTTTPQAAFTWLNGNRFYTLTTVTDQQTELLFCRLGANDPEFNLRPDPSFIIRQNETKHHTFVSTIEPHGSKNPVTELTFQLEGDIKNIAIIHQDTEYIAIKISFLNQKMVAILSLMDNATQRTHSLPINGKLWEWKGPYMQQFLGRG